MNAPKAIVTFLLPLLMFSVQNICAQETLEREAEAVTHKEWYGGIEGGVPFGVSTFSSFGADKTRAGYNIGVFGGYRFNPVLSAELSAKWGKTNLSARDCCTESGYWLGADGITYHAPVAGFSGADYADLKSSVSLQQYVVRLNVNLLGFFRRTRQSRWRIELSPMLSAVGTKADVKTIADGNCIIKDKTRWHLGACGNLQASYNITDNLHLGIYSGITFLTGKGMDGVAKHIHDDNFLWESGVRIGLSFGKCRKKTKHTVQSVPTINEKPVEEVKASVQQNPDVMTETDTEEEKATIETKDKEIVFPVIYFDFNKTDIKSSEIAKLRDISQLLRKNPNLKITIAGWADPKGGTAVNNRISLRRAETVRSWLVGQGIDNSRMEVLGMGIDCDEPDASKARRVVVTDTDRKEAQK